MKKSIRECINELEVYKDKLNKKHQALKEENKELRECFFEAIAGIEWYLEHYKQSGKDEEIDHEHLEKWKKILSINSNS